VASAAAVLPILESSVGHRIGFAAPWWAVLPVMAMAMAAAATAAWWPSRALTRQSIVATLASQRPQIRPVSRTTAIGVVATLAGTAAMAVGFVRVVFPLALGGIVAALVGLLMLSPAAVKLIGRGAGRLPLPVRLAARAIARLQGRSAAVVSALVIALGVPAGLAVASAAIDDRDRRAEDNLPDHMAILWLPGAEQSTPEIPAELDAAAAARSLDRATAAVPGARVAPIEVAVDPRLGSTPARFERLGLRPAVFPNLALRPVTEPCNCDVAAYGDRDETGVELLFTEDDAWVANPALLDVLGIEVPSVRSGLGLSRWDDAVLHSHRQPDGPAQRLQVNPAIPPFSSIAPVLIWPETVATHDWEAVTVGWLIVADTPLTPAVAADLSSAAGPDLLTDLPAEPAPRSGLRLAGLLVGAVIGLGILVSVVSLHIAESARDLQILRAIGASPRTGRRLSAATAAILAASAALIAVPAGYLPLVAMMADRALDFRFVVPWASLAAIVFVFPLLAAAIGWASSIRSSNRVRLLP
jgi:putative ABC transport system permease protein